MALPPAPPAPLPEMPPEVDMALLRRLAEMVPAALPLPPEVSQGWATCHSPSRVLPMPCPPWPGLVWQPAESPQGADVQVLWALPNLSFTHAVDWPATLGQCWQRARPQGRLVVLTPQPWPVGLAELGWGEATRTWRSWLQGAGWRPTRSTSVGGRTFKLPGCLRVVLAHKAGLSGLKAPLAEPYVAKDATTTPAPGMACKP